MNTVAEKDHEKENKLTLELLEAIEQRDDISQRHLAQKMGVALGLANSYLKRCVKKGWIKIKTAPANRYLYYLTPNGFAEKTRLTGEFLSTSLTLFRQSGNVYQDLFQSCLAQGQSRIVLAGVSDLTDIAYLRSRDSEIEIVAVFQPNSNKSMFFEYPIVDKLPEANRFDAVIMTSLEQTEPLLESIAEQHPNCVVHLPSFLSAMQYRGHDQSDTEENMLNEDQIEGQTMVLNHGESQSHYKVNH